ncbi:MAG TPA: SAM-dependent chlorinase/fluorinase [Tepidisphaeraceae bacterium]|nr:SAM-dependent chlorinase/fluorinase [Tepidisphaeraceae bacterium]
MTLTTDFGGTDSYVAEMKGVLLRECPSVAIVDVTHAVPPQDVLAGSIVLERAVRAFPPGTVHVAVVDPGVGTDRRLILTTFGSQIILCPDNGLITWLARREPDRIGFRELIWRPDTAPSPTFHGRDIMAPAAAAIARDARLVPRWAHSLGADEVTLLPIDVAPDNATTAEVIYVDHYGNAVTNLPGERSADLLTVRVGRRSVRVQRTYADVPVGRPVALIGSSGLLEIAVRNGNAARDLRLKVGSRIRLT